MFAQASHRCKLLRLTADSDCNCVETVLVSVMTRLLCTTWRSSSWHLNSNAVKIRQQHAFCCGLRSLDTVHHDTMRSHGSRHVVFKHTWTGQSVPSTVHETVFNNAGVQVQSDFLIYLITGCPTEADLANFASLGKAHLYKGHESYDKNYSLQILCKHDRYDKRMSERHVLHFTEADKLQILLKFLHSHPARPNQEEQIRGMSLRRQTKHCYWRLRWLSFRIRLRPRSLSL